MSIKFLKKSTVKKDFQLYLHTHFTLLCEEKTNHNSFEFKTALHKATIVLMVNIY